MSFSKDISKTQLLSFTITQFNTPDFMGEQNFLSKKGLSLPSAQAPLHLCPQVATLGLTQKTVQDKHYTKSLEIDYPNSGTINHKRVWGKDRMFHGAAKTALFAALNLQENRTTGFLRGAIKRLQYLNERIFHPL
ncbi:hypothetical protein RUM43_011698 [Polyplax serrata]|uniref:Uncharacterized protein n=1 Tax=Polyplax serrata TaxID=468196 RepID=A0AAN8S192_POLSC